ncbi:hypothetical protein CVT26_015606 [Gymnopilus dilepis]|uniref:Uncharacterized protein n=1 Tax=Gymnopilus dilepis TaxID=231916 RepID=A0A409XYL7_9AGAR|nr:hypothetical protein CVT26_015606 [Gymnopilus dilepis]
MIGLREVVHGALSDWLLRKYLVNIPMTTTFNRTKRRHNRSPLVKFRNCKLPAALQSSDHLANKFVRHEVSSAPKAPHCGPPRYPFHSGEHRVVVNALHSGLWILLIQGVHDKALDFESHKPRAMSASELQFIYRPSGVYSQMTEKPLKVCQVDRVLPVISAGEEHLQTSDAVGEHIGQIFSMAKFHCGFICSAGLSDEKKTPPAYRTNKSNTAGMQGCRV